MLKVLAYALVSSFALLVVAAIVAGAYLAINSLGWGAIVGLAVPAYIGGVTWAMVYLDN